MNTKTIAYCAMMTAIISVLAPLAIPLSGGVPISLATFAVMLAGATLGPKYGTLSVLLYLIIGSIGIPVFANYASGFANVIGSTGGYLIGYLPLAFCTGFFYETFNQKIAGLILGIIVGEIILYTLGTIWFMFVSQTNLASSLAWCVIPFIPGDIAKIVAVCILSPVLKKALHKVELNKAY